MSTENTENTSTPKKVIQLSERHFTKLAGSQQVFEQTVTIARDAQRVADEKKQEAQRAAQSRGAIFELVFEVLGAPQDAEVDFEKGTLTWTVPLADDIGANGVSESAALPPQDAPGEAPSA